MSDNSPLDVPVVAYIAASLEQAHIVRNALEQQGIRATVTNAALQFGVGDLPMGTPTAARVVVNRQDLPEARQIVEAFDRGTAQEEFGEGGEDLEVSDSEENEYEYSDEADESVLNPEPETPWPRCPSCGQRRHTQCPSCGTAGSRFPRAYVPPGAAPADSTKAQPLSLVCQICDELFTAEFPARCEWCGYRFADGRELPPSPEFIDEVNSRVWIVMAGLLALAGLVLAWGWYVAPRS